MDPENSETASRQESSLSGGIKGLSRRRSLGFLGAGVTGWAMAAAGRPLAMAMPSRTNTAGVRAPAKRGLRLACLSDLNGPYGTTSYLPSVHRAVALIPELDVDLALCAGDMVAGQRRGLGRAWLAAMWTAFERDVLSPLRRRGLPFLPAMGNHDASSQRSGGCYVFAEDRAEAGRFWNQRRDALGLSFIDAGGFPFHYAVRQQSLVLLVWDASSDSIPQAQLSWAASLLRDGAARAASTRLAMGHLPLQAVAQGRDRPGEVLRDGPALLHRLQDGGVRAYISGHHHAWFPARAGQIDLLHLGAAGNGPRRLLGSSRSPRHTLTLIDLPDAGDSDLGSGALQLTTFDLGTGIPIALDQLPGAITDRNGHRLVRWRPS